jgi:O-antigen/teichoic acid export membrane protein
MIAGKITALLATFAVPLILTRLLSKSEYGVFAQFYVVVFFCTGVFNLSMQSNLYFFYPTVNDQVRKTIVFQTLIFLVLVAILAVSLMGIPEIGKFIIGEGDLINYKSYVLWGIVLLMPVYILEPLYVVKKDLYTSLIYPPAEVLLRLSLVIGLFIIKPGLHSVFSGIIIAASVCLVFILSYTFREIGIKNINKSILNLELAGKQLKYSIPFGIASSMNILFQRFDKIICISFLTSSEFAIYAISFYGIPGIMQVFDSLAQVYLIQMTIKHQENKTNELNGIYKTLVTKTYSFSLPAMLIVMLYSKKIIQFLFTSNYLDAVPLFRVYLISVLVFMLSSGLILRATGKTNYTLRSYSISGAFVLPLTYFLIKFLGMWGAMTGALISISLPRFLNLAAEIKLLKCNFFNFFPWKNFAQITLISFISIIPFLAVEYYFDYGIFVTFMLGILYIIIVSLLELRYDLFPMDSSTIKARVVSRFSFLLPTGLFKNKF